MGKENKKSGLATAGMVLGIIAIPGAWIPFLNIVSIILGALALIFGAIALLQKRSLGKAVTAVVLGLLSVIIAITMLVSASKAIDDALNSDGKKVGTSSEEGKNSDVENFKVGDVVAFDGREVSVTSVKRNYSGGEFATPEKGNEFVKVNVTIKNKSDEKLSYNTLDWEIEDSQGNIEDYMDAMMAQADDDLGSGDLAAGGKKKGSIVFSVPKGDKGLVLHFSPSFWSDKNVEIKL